MRRIEPTYPDLLPFTHQLGHVPLGPGGLALDLVGMRLLREAMPASMGDSHVPRRPLRFLVYASVLQNRHRAVERLLAAGCGVLVVVDTELEISDLPSALAPEQVTLINLWLSPFWGEVPMVSLASFREEGFATGTLVALTPQFPIQGSMTEALVAAQKSGAQFVLFAPLSLSGEDKHLAYEAAFGEEGNDAFEDLLFHTEPVEVAKALEVHGSSMAPELGLREGLLGPGTALCKASCFAAACSLLLWARRLDLLDGVASQGWRLRRAAQALLVSGRDPFELMEEDNLRLVPGFDGWVEAFARSLWSRDGEPFVSLWLRWLGVAR